MNLLPKFAGMGVFTAVSSLITNKDFSKLGSGLFGRQNCPKAALTSSFHKAIENIGSRFED